MLNSNNRTTVGSANNSLTFPKAYLNGGGEGSGPVARAATEAATAAAGSAAADSAAADSVAARAVARAAKRAAGSAAARAATKAAGEEGEDCQQTRPLARPRKGTQRSHSTPPSRDDDGVE